MMETETIDKLFLELSQVTSAKTKRELALERAIDGALKIKDLWLPSGSVSVEHEGEAQALDKMYRNFCRVLNS